MTLRQRILLLGLLAVVGTLLALWLQARNYATQSRSIAAIAVNVKVVGALSQATHKLQTERGRMTIGRARTDGQALTDLVRDTDTALSRLAAAGIGVVSLGETLVHLRTGSAAGTLLPLAVLDRYSALLQTVIDEMGRLTRPAETAFAKADIEAYAHLVAAKEYLGQTRATLGYWIEHQRDDAEIMLRLIRLKGLHDEEMRRFGLEAAPELRQLFAAQFADESVQQTLAAVTRITASGQLPRELDVRTWWSMATAAIDRLKLVEDYSLNSIETRAEKKLAQLRSTLHVEVLATLAVGLAVVILAVSAIVTLIRTLNCALASIESIAASQNFHSRMPADTPDEIGRISRGFNRLLEVAERLLTEKDYLATTDPLTGINNRLRFANVLRDEVERKRRTETPMALVMFDIDNFKRINDRHGHNVGDEVLRRLASIVGSEIRATDVFARWGGEEFVVLFRDEDCDAAIIAAEKLRRLIAGADFPTVGQVKCSFGVAAWTRSDSEANLVARADQALYVSKRGGRNRVSCPQGAWGSCHGRIRCAAT